MTSLLSSLPLLGVIPTNRIAEALLEFIRRILDAVGINRHTRLDEIIYFVVVCVLAVTIAWLARLIAIWLLRKGISLRDNQLAEELVKAHTVSRCTHIIPPLVLMSFLPLAFEGDELLHTIILRALWVYFVVTFGVGLNAVITFAWLRFDERENSKKHPLRGLLGTAHGIVWIIVVIISISIIVNRSPGYLLTGMAALSAAVMLIFKDSILGFVSGIQLSVNDMLRVGDWIVVPSVSANGIVEDVTLTVVKVRGWDNTVIMLPPYTLVSTSFQNYRGMYETGFRRIDQQFIIDVASVKTLTPDMIEHIENRLPVLKDFVTQALSLQNQGKTVPFNGGTAAVNGTIDTNVGLFRAYLCLYLQHHECISAQQYLMVRLMAPTPQGVPLQIYCFTEGDAIYWLKYEAVQSEIMEHIMAVAPIFGLEIYNEMSRNQLEITSPSALSTPAQKTSAPADSTTAGNSTQQQ